MTATEKTLIEHDLKGSHEYPPSFDLLDLERRAFLLLCELEAVTGRRLAFEGGIHNQDASFSVTIRLSETPYKNLTYVCDLRFSNFGEMVAVTDENYEATTECSDIFEIARRHRFVPIRRELLDRPYDGVNGDAFDTWWIRFFDWL
ncbi:hypothetical protein Pla108_36840 [Botrimarina colliarenosi]|uniref:Uncharacterized protein n=1 Tax=Botrimarina colliarenosi TaxID=2528001 RepID=A0A5C6A925_9BACT|nr:hypothetical protein [Botrimarina colliarenosi]TWT94833.1 hypothetical protein Pla108_36840 [Botrimarina colliarenosi]